MLFDALMITCLVHGTSHRESGVVVSVKPDPDEIILFFAIDEQSNPKSRFRSILKIRSDERLADLLLFYQKGEKLILAIVEQKGKNIQIAGEQVANTARHLQKYTKESTYLRDVKIRLCIRPHHKSSLQNTKQVLNSIKKQTGLDCKLIKVPDIGSFLRT